MSILHYNELINIEEDLLNPIQMTRQFTFCNRANGLKLGIITFGASISTCLLGHDTQEIVVNPAAIDGGQCDGPRSIWSSHVLGLDSVLLTSSNSNSIMYQLTSENELIITGKLKGQQFIEPFYFNLNSVTDKTTVDGHSLHIKSSGSSSNDISEPGPPIKLAGDIPFNLSGQAPCQISLTDGSEQLAYEAVFTCVGDLDTAIIARLEYGSKLVEVSVQNNSTATLAPSSSMGNGLLCKLKCRISREGICLMPTLMNEFRCIYKFGWS